MQNAKRRGEWLEKWGICVSESKSEWMSWWTNKRMNEWVYERAFKGPIRLTSIELCIFHVPRWCLFKQRSIWTKIERTMTVHILFCCLGSVFFSFLHRCEGKGIDSTSYSTVDRHYTQIQFATSFEPILCGTVQWNKNSCCNWQRFHRVIRRHLLIAMPLKLST